MSGIERYYEIVQVIYDSCTILSAAYCLVLWISPFLAGRAKAWRVGAAYAAAGFFLGFIPVPVNMLFFYVSLVAAAFLVMIRIDREYIAQKIFLVVSFFCIRWYAWRIVGCIGNEIFGLLSRTLLYGQDDMIWFRAYAVQTAIEETLGCLLMYGAVRCLLWAYGRRREQMNGREFLLLVIPSVSGGFAYGVFRWYNDVYERNTGQSIWDLYGSHDLLMLLYSAFGFATILATAYVFRQWKNEREEDKKQEVFLRQMQDLESHIAEVEGLYRDMRNLRHDMGNHLMTLERLYDRGACEEAGKYAETLKETVRKVSPDVVSGNPVTDVILSGQKKRMEEKGIAFDCDFHYPQKGEVNAFDISIILQNALTNAIEAAEREKPAGGAHISVVSYFAKNMYMIEVANSYTGELTVDEHSGLPMTTKAGGGHGFGLENIRRAARSYFGDMEIGREVYAGEECCVLRVMLQIAGA
ncbi:MAG: GHKL domain-containing protein [Blautia sp.]|nr:GHKL domain-containing protein [Blautia sp.]MCM1200990.1 GHKL domain-containing protein [Bacteroides fragilis]